MAHWGSRSLGSGARLTDKQASDKVLTLVGTMGEPIDRIIQRAGKRSHWRVEPSTHGDGRCLVRSAIHDILVDGLSRTEAEAIAGSYNAARDEAASLANQFHLSYLD